jgi:hypothetical protein
MANYTEADLMTPILTKVNQTLTPSVKWDEAIEAVLDLALQAPSGTYHDLLDDNHHHARLAEISKAVTDLHTECTAAGWDKQTAISTINTRLGL